MTTLIHLVSEQTMQNLLPILALRPERVVQIRSGSPEFQRPSESLERAVRVAFQPDSEPAFETVQLPEEAPSPGSVEARVRELLARHADAIVNITGGTKLMSLGAWQAARGRAPVLYCDTRERRFIFLHGAAPAGLASFDEVASRLTVQIVLAAHGVSPEGFHYKEAPESLLEIGRAGWACWLSHRKQFLQFCGTLRTHFRDGGDRIPEGRQKLEQLVRKPLPAPDPAWGDFYEALVRPGFLRREGTEYFAAVEPDKREVERLANLLSGSWLELAVLSQLRKNDRWLDPHWSVQPRNQEQAVFGETDVVCIDRRRAALQIISCKTELRNPLETFEALAQRRQDLGGSHARAALAVLDVEDRVRAQLLRWAELIRLDLWIGEEIYKRLIS